MKKQLFCCSCIFTLSVAMCFGLYSFAKTSVSPVTMTMRSVGSGKGNIEPGIYTISGTEQVRVTNDIGAVTMFRGRLNTNAEKGVELNDGYNIEFLGKMYLFKDNEETNSLVDTFFYSPMKTISIFQSMPGYYTEIKDGTAIIYDAMGEIKQTAYVYIPDGLSGYIFNGDKEDISKDTVPEPTGTPVKLNAGKTYVIGVDIAAGAYLASGSGIVRVYDAGGYVRTVIRLKKENSSGEGVESYIFKLLENETFITEENVELREVNTSKD